MKLYLVRHAEALDKREDRRRPLSTKGIADARQLAAMLTPLRLRVAAIGTAARRVLSRRPRSSRRPCELAGISWRGMI